MRIAILLVLALAGCGGEGQCAMAVCQAPQRTCASVSDCFNTEFCDFSDNACGSTEPGRCRSRPDGCSSQSLNAICACDGTFYASTCAAQREGVDISDAGGCSLPAGTFACGARACSTTTEVCFEVMFQGEDGSSSFQCQQLPQQCVNDRTCDCVQNFFGCEKCSAGAGLTLECRPAFPEG